MKREIKFRAWDKASKKMIYSKDGCVMEWVKGDLRYFNYKNVKGSVDTELVVMQYTGLLDKNGKEVYEGDVLESNFDELMRDVVIYEECWFALRDNSTGFCQLRIEDWQWEIIGNIYENPELVDNAK